ncbi:MAG: 4-hydroxy-tetrahydrodipicolinate synthase [Methanomassiliicoccales archaeon]|nr:4-hydroxy-tetrahydrodipicolinate synthase [Methanomassiliicoccales archaeon]
MLKAEWLKGVYPALVTPFKSDESMDEEKLRNLVEHLMPDVDGFVVNGTTGEFVYMSEEERNRAIEVVVDQVDGRKPVIAGTGSSGTKITVQLTKDAMDLGADAALVVTPYYFNPSWKEIYEHFDEVNSVGLPIILYNIPQCTTVHQKWWTSEGLAYLDNVIGIKDSSGDMPYMAALFEKFRGKISILCGHDEIAMAAMAEGADGVILASANLIPNIWQDIRRHIINGEIEEARQLQQKIQKLVRIVTRTSGPQSCKAGLWMMGVDPGKARRPTMPGDAFQHEDLEELRIELENVGKISKREIEYDLGNKTVRTDVFATPQTPSVVRNFGLLVGEGFAGPPVQETAHTDLLIGVKGGPVDKAIDRALEVDVDQVKMRIVLDRPRTLLVPTISTRTASQEELLYVHAADGLKWGIEASIKDGFLPEEILDDIVLLANVFVHPAAANKRRVMVNNYKAARHAIRKAIEGRPTMEEIFYQKRSVRHPFKYTP